MTHPPVTTPDTSQHLASSELGTTTAPAPAPVQATQPSPPAPAALPNPLMTAEEVSAYLVIPVATLYAWRSRGQGPVGHRVGRHLRYRLSDVDAWLNDQPS